MLLNDKASSFLYSSDNISSGHLFPTGSSKIIKRNTLLQQLATGKSCLHLGCADHIDLIEIKRSKGTYLHDILTASASSLIGIDTNAKAIREMNGIGISNVYLPDESPSQKEYDVVFVPDVIEHVPNVGIFLQEIKAHPAKQYIFTTPNAFRLKNRFQLKGELVNTDHKYWFSPYTLAKTLCSAGYRIENVWYTDTLKATQPIRSLIKLLFPICRDGICMSATIQRLPA